MKHITETKRRDGGASGLSERYSVSTSKLIETMLTPVRLLEMFGKEPVSFSEEATVQTEGPPD